MRDDAPETRDWTSGRALPLAVSIAAVQHRFDNAVAQGAKPLKELLAGIRARLAELDRSEMTT